MPPTWDEYLASLGEYLGDLRRALQAGFRNVPPPPPRPEGTVPEALADVAVGLGGECERLIGELSDRMAVIAGRGASRASPHQARPAAYVIADI